MTSKKTWQRILAATFAKDPQVPPQTQLVEKPLIQDQAKRKSRFATKIPFRFYVYISIAAAVTFPGIITVLLYGYEPAPKSESAVIPLSPAEMNMTQHEYAVSKCGAVPINHPKYSNPEIAYDPKPIEKYWSCYGESSKEFRDKLGV